VRVTFGVLGPLAALVDGRPARLGGPRQRAVLAVLLLRAGQVVPPAVLVDAVWGEEPPAWAGNLLQGYVSGLRKELGRESIETCEPGYRMTVATDALDLRRFERLAADGNAALGHGRTEHALDLLRSALDLWRGPALADIQGAGMLPASVARLEEMRLAVRELRAEAQLSAGHARLAATELAVIVEDYPLREEPRALLMTALYRCGRQAEALEVFRRGRDALVTELGIEPGAALRDLEQAILRQDEALRGPTDRPPGAAVPDRTPLPGSVPVPDRRQRTVLVAALDTDSLPGLIDLAEPLVRGGEGGELILATTVRDVADLTASVATLRTHRTELDDRGVSCRIAAFTSLTPGADLARLASEQDAALLLVDAPDGLLEDARLMTVLEHTPCDVAVLVPGPARDGPVLVAFAGADHDWAAVELGAWFSRRTGATLLLAGALSGNGRDASRLLANASLAVQRALGVAAEPLLIEPQPDALVAAAGGARLVVVGLTERWRHDGVGRARTALATAGTQPTVLVRRGLRPGGLAARDPGTRYTWTVAGLG
jgi:DNA-binding SARP family transcriptional activator